MDASGKTRSERHTESCGLEVRICSGDAIQQSNRFNWLTFDSHFVATFYWLELVFILYVLVKRTIKFSITVSVCGHSSRCSSFDQWTPKGSWPACSHRVGRPADSVRHEWGFLGTFSQFYGWSIGVILFIQAPGDSWCHQGWFWPYFKSTIIKYISFVQPLVPHTTG